MKPVIWLLAILGLLAMGAGAFLWSGTYNVAADEPHWSITARAMEVMRERSIAARASEIAVPDLEDEARIRRGAGNYDAMCAACHLRPGVDQSELSAGLYPAPPNFARQQIDSAAEAFWSVKHGIKMTGMPAWGKAMNDAYVWDIVAFARQLPAMPKARYDQLVESSEGHAHVAEDGETLNQGTTPHVHDDGKVHEHPN